MVELIRRAGLEPWPKTFQNLRSTGEIELAEKHPIHVVCKWIGNSAAIAATHYLQLTHDHFARAARENNQSKATQNPTQKVHESARNGQNGHRGQDDEKTSISRDFMKKRLSTAECERRLMTPTGFEPVKNPYSEAPTAGGTHIGIQANAEAGADVPSVANLTGQKPTRRPASPPNKRKPKTNDQKRRETNARYAAARDAEREQVQAFEAVTLDRITSVWERLSEKDRFGLITLAEQMAGVSIMAHRSTMAPVEVGKTDLLTTRQTAQRLGVKPATLRGWNTRGWLKPAKKIGSQNYYERNAVEVAARKYLKAQEGQKDNT